MSLDKKNSLVQLLRDADVERDDPEAKAELKNEEAFTTKSEFETKHCK